MKLLEDYWYIACAAKQLNREPLARRVLSEHLVLFRDRTGAVGAVLDRCPHRNLALSRGHLTEKGLQCAYHGWTYNTQGACVDIPASCEGPDSGVAIRSYPTRESQGFIWVYMNSSRSKKPSGPPPEFPLYDDKKASVWHMERIFEADAIHCAENFLDVPHTVFVHAGFFRNQSHQELEFEVTGGKDWVQAEFFNERAFDTFLGRLLIPKNTTMTHTDRFILPATTRVDYHFGESRQFVVMSQCTPITENSCRVFTYMAFRFDPIAPLIKLIYGPLSARILKQDVDLLREQSEDIKRSGKPSFYFHHTDAIAREIYILAQGKKPRILAGRRKMVI